MRQPLKPDVACKSQKAMGPVHIQRRGCPSSFDNQIVDAGQRGAGSSEFGAASPRIQSLWNRRWFSQREIICPSLVPVLSPRAQAQLLIDSSLICASRRGSYHTMGVVASAGAVHRVFAARCFLAGIEGITSVVTRLSASACRALRVAAHLTF